MLRLQASRAVAVGLWWASVLGCSVFPDHAPDLSDALGADAGGGSGALASGSGGEAGLLTQGGAGAQGGTGGSGGGGVAGSSSGGNSGSAGAGAGAGAGGMPACSSRRVKVVATADAWIDAAQPGANHGADLVLDIAPDPNEQRAVFAFALPALTSGDELVGAAVVLTPDPSAAPATASLTFEVHTLDDVFNESRVTWNNYSNGASRKWLTPGGDFGTDFGTGALKPGAAALRIDAIAMAAAAYAAKQQTLTLIVLEPASGGSGPLVVVSREGAAGDAPSLNLDICGP